MAGRGAGIGFLLLYGIIRHWLLIPVFLVGVLILGGLTGLLSQKMKSGTHDSLLEKKGLYYAM